MEEEFEQSETLFGSIGRAALTTGPTGPGPRGPQPVGGPKFSEGFLK